MKYSANMKDALLSYLLRQSNIKTEKQLMALADSSWKYFPYTVIITGAYMIFYQGGTFDQGTHIWGPVSKSSA